MYDVETCELHEAELPELASRERRNILLLGDVGTGKSTIVEKVTGVTGLSSDADESFTRSSRAYITTDGKLQLIDTPGSNAMTERLEHNVWIAHALNSDPVNLILLTVKADTRIDNTIATVRDYAERFQDFESLLALCITHMDTVKWEQQRFTRVLDEQLALRDVVFTSKDSQGRQLRRELLRLCGTPHDITIDGNSFLKYFKLSNSNVKVLRTVKREVEEFKIIRDSFVQQFYSFPTSEQVDAVFEFQAFMTERIFLAQKRVAEANDFHFDTGNEATTANEAAHIASLTNQLKAVLLDIRHLAFTYQHDVGNVSLRRCPHCSTVWTKVTGCDGQTTCGNRINEIDGRYGQFAHFSFNFDGEKLEIKKVKTRQVQLPMTSGGNIGCGQTICWGNMAPVSVPSEFQACAEAVSVEDVSILPEPVRIAATYIYDQYVAACGTLRRFFSRKAGESESVARSRADVRAR
eukprot:TRINITY_DN77744_c0_g1_i1.p1 TRINITY_DN77744_c0_g1~~TRINITY_DN77744_c0_g1_i1.p1  ORF type:complete len:487 (-),score=72.98 TRINITY_DN77744_c0_g1_i1:110-1504(-)